MILVYEINTGEGFYNGVTSNPKYRFRPSAYKKERKLHELIEKYGWKEIKNKITIVGKFEDRAEALKLEDELIIKHRNEGNSLNEYRSGKIWATDANHYRKLWVRKYRAEQKQQKKYNE